MNNASPCPTFPTFPGPCNRGSGLAPFNVLDCEDFEHGADLPPRGLAAHPAAESRDDFGGLLISLGWSLPVGLMTWLLAWWLMP